MVGAAELGSASQGLLYEAAGGVKEPSLGDTFIAESTPGLTIGEAVGAEDNGTGGVTARMGVTGRGVPRGTTAVDASEHGVEAFMVVDGDGDGSTSHPSMVWDVSPRIRFGHGEYS